MPVLFDYDPVTGISQHFDYDPVSEQIHLTSSQDLTFFLEELKQKRNNPEAWKKGIKESWAHYASVPPVIEMELLKKGLSLSNPDQYKEIFREINTNYPFLKTTTAYHE